MNNERVSMMSKKYVGVGYSSRSNGFMAGAEATRKAMDSGNISDPSFVLAFAANRTDSEEFLHGIQSVAGSNTPIAGGAAVGIITCENLSYSETPSGVVVFDSALLKAKTAQVHDIDHDLNSAGMELIKELTPNEATKAILIFFDSMLRPGNSDTPPSIPSSRPILQGIHSRLACDIPIFGAGMISDFELSSSFILGKSGTGEKCMAGAALSGNFRVYSTITHGSVLLDGIYHRITRQQGAAVMELDGKPIVETINEIYGNDSWQKERPVTNLTLGINNGPKFGEFYEDAYVNRLIVGPLPDKSGVILFEEGPQAGDEIQFLQRDPIKTIESTREKTLSILDDIAKDGKRPVFALYIDCAGRAASVSLTKSEEAAIVQEAMGTAGIPLLGFYSGIEIAPIRGASRGLDWTGVLMMLAVD